MLHILLNDIAISFSITFFSPFFFKDLLNYSEIFNCLKMSVSTLQSLLVNDYIKKLTHQWRKVVMLHPFARFSLPASLSAEIASSYWTSSMSYPVPGPPTLPLFPCIISLAFTWIPDWFFSTVVVRRNLMHQWTYGRSLSPSFDFFPLFSLDVGLYTLLESFHCQ